MVREDKAVTLNIEKLEERDNIANVLVYGETGVGKTVFASTAPRPILWLESEGGTNSIADPTGIDIARVTSLETYREAVRYLRANPDTYSTVVLDSFTETQAQILKEIMRKAVQMDTSGERDEFSPLFQEYQRLTGVTREIARSFRDLPQHVVITALERTDKDDMTGRTRVRPRLTPTVADELPGFMDVVGYMYTATKAKGEVDEQGAVGDDSDDEPIIVRNMLIQPTGKYMAKIRARADLTPPNVLRNPTFDDVLDVMGIN